MTTEHTHERARHRQPGGFQNHRRRGSTPRARARAKKCVADVAFVLRADNRTLKIEEIASTRDRVAARHHKRGRVLIRRGTPSLGWHLAVTQGPSGMAGSTPA